MLIDIHPANPQPRHIKQAVSILQEGGVIIYPTDTIYGIGCDIFHRDALERICRIKNIPLKNAQFSFICCDLSDISNYASSIDTPTFRLLKQSLPGPYTFILGAGRNLPKMMQTKKSTVGIRVPDCKITHALVRELGRPLLSASLPTEADVEYYTDPELIHEQFGKSVDLVIDGGMGGMVPSTVIDLTSGSPEVIRHGAGKWEE